MTFGNHMYRQEGERCDVEFIDDRLGIRKALTSGKMDKEEYDIWLEDTLKLFNVPIDEYI